MTRQRFPVNLLLDVNRISEDILTDYRDEEFAVTDDETLNSTMVVAVLSLSNRKE
jgi:hypothetical protein